MGQGAAWAFHAWRAFSRLCLVGRAQKGAYAIQVPFFFAVFCSPCLAHMPACCWLRGTLVTGRCSFPNIYCRHEKARTDRHLMLC